MKNGRPITHGLRPRGVKSKEYIAWNTMKQRCYNPNSGNYKYYGGLGVTVCKEWLDSYEAFINYVGPAPSKAHTLDRHPNKSGNYEPGNVRWATPTQQARNTAKNRIITYNGESLCVSEWASKTGMWPSVIAYRLNQGYPLEVVFNKKRVN